MNSLYIALLIFLMPINMLAQWNVQRTGTSDEFFYNIFFISNDHGWTIDDQAFYWTIDGGEVWHKRTLVEGIWRSIYFLNDSVGFIGGTKIMKTEDSGTTWSIVKELSIYRVILSIDFLDDSIGFAVGGQDLFYNATILKTTDCGNTWNEIASPIQDCLYSISAIKISEDSSMIIIVGKNTSILRSFNEGNTWSISQISSSYNFEVQFISAKLGWISSYAWVYRTTNGGESWFRYWVDPNLVGNNWTIFFIDSSKGWTSNGDKIYVSTNGGITWQIQLVNYGSGINSVYFVDKNEGWACGGQGLILHTQNGGVTFVRDDEKNKNRPESFSLFQNYPNPFNPATKIKYSFPQSSKVVLKVFDVLGNEIETLVKEEKPAGEYEVEFNGTNLPSGIYFYRLQAGNFVETKKMILLR